MAENKTKPTQLSVEQFLNQIPEETKRRDSFAVLEMMQRMSQQAPVMWGSSIVGFGSYHYKYESGREGDMPLVGFSPRKQNLALYIMGGFENYRDLMEKLGKYKTGKGCLYINKLDEVNPVVLEQLIRQSVETMLRNPG